MWRNEKIHKIIQSVLRSWDTEDMKLFLHFHIFNFLQGIIYKRKLNITLTFPFPSFVPLSPKYCHPLNFINMVDTMCSTPLINM